MVVFRLHFRANRIGQLCLEFLKKYDTAKLNAKCISPNIGFFWLIEAHGTRDCAQSTKCVALYRLRLVLSPLSQRSRITQHGHDTHAHELWARTWPVRPSSLSSA